MQPYLQINITLYHIHFKKYSKIGMNFTLLLIFTETSFEYVDIGNLIFFK